MELDYAVCALEFVVSHLGSVKVLKILTDMRSWQNVSSSHRTMAH